MSLPCQVHEVVEHESHAVLSACPLCSDFYLGLFIALYNRDTNAWIPIYVHVELFPPAGYLQMELVVYVQFLLQKILKCEPQ